MSLLRTVALALSALMAACTDATDPSLPARSTEAPGATATQAGAPGTPVVSTRPTLPPPPEIGWSAFPAASEAGLGEPLAARLDTVLVAALGDEARVGVAGAVIVGGVGTWAGVAGHAGDGRLASATTRWSTGSIAKTAVAAEVLSLVDDGDVELDSDIGTLLADESVETNGATIADLLRMRSGIATGAPAGSTFAYRDGDYILLGRVIERVTGDSLGEALEAGVLDVPGAEGLRFPAGGTVTNAAGPFEADAPSVARWGYELFGGRVVTNRSLARMVDFEGGDYGMGVFDFSVDFSELAAGHLGADAPASAALVVLPDRATAIAVLMSQPDPLRTEAIAVSLSKLLPRLPIRSPDH